MAKLPAKGVKRKPKSKRKVDGRAERTLSVEQWIEAQELYEDDSVRVVSAVEVANVFKIKSVTVTERIKRFHWTRRSRKQLVHVPRPNPPWRPPLYREDFPQRLLDYFSKRVFNSTENLKLMKEGVEPEDCDDRFAVVSLHRRVPTLMGFAETIGVTYETLHDWATKKLPSGELRYPHFSYAYKMAKNKLAKVLIEGGTAGLLQANFTGLVAKNLVGWQDSVAADSDVEAVGRVDIHKDVYQNVRIRARIEEAESHDLDETPTSVSDPE